MTFDSFRLIELNSGSKINTREALLSRVDAKTSSASSIPPTINRCAEEIESTGIVDLFQTRFPCAVQHNFGGLSNNGKLIVVLAASSGLLKCTFAKP